MLSAHIELARRACDSHVSVSKQLAPVDTGELRDSIHVEGAAVDPNTAQLRDIQSGQFVKPTGSPSDVERRVVVDAAHGIFVEFGTVNMAAQPFFLPGFGSAERQYRTEAEVVIGRTLKGGGI
jgi:HK97 gp10 family phage protein